MNNISNEEGYTLARVEDVINMFEFSFKIESNPTFDEEQFNIFDSASQGRTHHIFEKTSQPNEILATVVGLNNEKCQLVENFGDNLISFDKNVKIMHTDNDQVNRLDNEKCEIVNLNETKSLADEPPLDICSNKPLTPDFIEAESVAVVEKCLKIDKNGKKIQKVKILDSDNTNDQMKRSSNDNTIFVFHHGTVRHTKTNKYFKFWTVSIREKKIKMRTKVTFQPIGLIKITQSLRTIDNYKDFIIDWTINSFIGCQISIKHIRINGATSKAYGYCMYNETEDTHRHFQFVQFKICLKDEDNQYVAIFSTNNDDDHTKNVKKHRPLRGVEREVAQRELQTKTVREVYHTTNDNIIEELARKGNLQKKTTLTALAKAATEMRQKGRSGCDVVDLILWSTLKEWSGLGSESFITTITSAVSLKILMLHPGVVNLFKNQEPKSLILHLDATGSLVKPISCHDHKLNKRVLEYVGMTKINGFSLNVIEMVSNSHTASSIQEMLDFAKNKWAVPVFKLVVSDWSWAQINAVLMSFNYVNVVEYLNMLYKKIVQDEQITLPYWFIYVSICSSHFMHCLSRYLKRHNPKHAKQNNLIMQTFFAMLNEDDFKKVEILYKDMCILFHSCYESEITKSAKKRMANYATTREFDVDNEMYIESVEDLKENPYSRKSNIKLFMHFKLINQETIELVKLDKSQDENDLSCFCNDEIMDKITCHFMPYLFLWSACGRKDIHNGRVNNGLIESNFKFYKTVLFKNKMRNNIIDYIETIFEHNSRKLKYVLNPSVYKDAERTRNVKRKIESNELPSDIEKFNNDYEEETNPLNTNNEEKWKKKMKSLKSKSESKYANFHVFRNFETPKAKRSLDFEEKKIKKETKKVKIIEKKFHPTMSPIVEVQDTNKVIARFGKQFLDSKSFSYLTQNQMLDNLTIEYCLNIMVHNRTEIEYVPIGTSTQIFLGENLNSDQINTIFNERKAFVKPITYVCPFFQTNPVKLGDYQSNHFLLVIIDFEKQKFLYFNSLKHAATNGIRYKKNFDKFVKNSNGLNTCYPHLEKLLQFEDVNGTKQEDATSCGVFVLAYAKMFIEKSSYQNINQLNERIFFQKLILNNNNN